MTPRRDSRTTHRRRYRVVVGEANDHVRRAIVDLLEDHPAFRVVAEGSEADDIAAQCALHRPHLAVIDVMETSLQRRLHQAIAAEAPDTIIAVYTARADRGTVDRLRREGVHTVFDKGGPRDLAEALHGLMRGQ